MSQEGLLALPTTRAKGCCVSIHGVPLGCKVSTSVQALCLGGCLPVRMQTHNSFNFSHPHSHVLTPSPCPCVLLSCCCPSHVVLSPGPELCDHQASPTSHHWFGSCLWLAGPRVCHLRPLAAAQRGTGCPGAAEVPGPLPAGLPACCNTGLLLS